MIRMTMTHVKCFRIISKFVFITYDEFFFNRTSDGSASGKPCIVDANLDGMFM